MANQEHLGILLKGVKAWNQWRKGNRHLTIDLSRGGLSRSDLQGVELYETDLRSANLHSTSLERADLRGANLWRTCLRTANLCGSALAGADLTEARLDGANLRDTDLSGVSFMGASLKGTDFQGAELAWTSFDNVDLSAAIGLDRVVHTGPSSIGIDTVYRSNGHIPESFLRGAGVPEKFITYMRSLTGAALDFYSCFISYSTKDQDFADRLHADLQARGVRCWFAPHDIQGGRKLHEQIDEAIRLYDKLLLILSDASMNSNWVKTEIANARAREAQQKRQMLFPITLIPFARIRDWKCFDADIGIDSAREIREYYVPDFSKWKDHYSYSTALERLVRDLKAMPERPDASASAG